MTTALVTGATAGIGATFARHLASRGHDLVLVARDEARLRSSAAELSRVYGVDVEVLRADLADREQTLQVAARVEDPERPVDLVVNNAGFGLHSRLLDPDTSTHERALDVMCRAVLLIGGAAGRAMRDRGRGTIINVASTAGWITLGHYSAIKSWVTVYTEGLAVELAGTGVTATALNPGWVHTEFHSRAGIGAGKIPEVAWVDVDRLVTECLDDAEHGRVISIPTRRWKVAIQLARHLPRRTIRWVSGKLSSSRRSH
ncbi:SDR family NAD(P)-dependent oxidoreductase [Auraticoccus sp. F435]|uniref:SDR family NAD(P)-dependent oxidoreductase n=1 Tax=Auraticoccus cholistanensis TaxID=2656650 RepID=A0A6A9UQ98_9ACTN|nr:SDR family NAD(P)-dependent oxidoreductase [Auraticoccus cholistanensis]MVA74728.1 SDR family NAD(P)-dependent oxidoreductase [Auraticoccus cholistanensis]